ncbi:MAG: hypothetical protein ACK5JT_09300 [Hyphomicrobiaceae bacterium]
MNTAILTPKRFIAFAALLLGLFFLSACSPSTADGPPTDMIEVETAAINSNEGEVGGYVEPVVEAAPLGTSWGETVSSSVGEGSSKLESLRPTQVVELHYSADPPRGQVSNEMLLVDHRLAVRVLREDGTPWPIYKVDGQVYLQGAVGERYSVELVNTSPTRDFGVIMSVDGLNVNTGRPVKIWGPGLQLAIGDSWHVKGFRINDDEVAAFRFSDPKDSVAMTRGSGSVKDAGVIRFKIYDIYVEK